MVSYTKDCIYIIVPIPEAALSPIASHIKKGGEVAIQALGDRMNTEESEPAQRH